MGGFIEDTATANYKEIPRDILNTRYEPKVMSKIIL